MASRRRLRRKSCEGKQHYATKAEAAAVQARAFFGRGERLRPYRCRFGDHWHIGHPPGSGGPFGGGRHVL